MFIEITGPATNRKTAIEVSTIARIHDERRAFGGTWAGCQLVLKNTRTKFWAAESYREVMAAIMAAQAGALPSGPPGAE